MTSRVCPICNTEKDIYVMDLNVDKYPIVACIECRTGSKELEEMYLETQYKFFNAADKIWSKLLS